MRHQKIERYFFQIIAFVYLAGFSYAEFEITRLGEGFNNAHAVTTFNDRFIVLGGWGAVATSADGVEWDIDHFPELDGRENKPFFRYAASSDDMLVLAGRQGRLIRSPNGKDWKWKILGVRNSETFRVTGIAYGNGRFVIVGGGFQIFTSEDGINWESEFDYHLFYPAGIGSLMGLYFDGTQFVIPVDGTEFREPGVGTQFDIPEDEDAYFLVSQDGVTWDAITFPKENTIILYSEGYRRIYNFRGNHYILAMEPRVIDFNGKEEVDRRGLVYSLSLEEGFIEVPYTDTPLVFRGPPWTISMSTIEDEYMYVLGREPGMPTLWETDDAINFREIPVRQEIDFHVSDMEYLNGKWLAIGSYAQNDTVVAATDEIEGLPYSERLPFFEENADNFGDNWYLTWLGLMNTNSWPWVLHAEMGWIYCALHRDNGPQYWFYATHPDLETWFWTNEDMEGWFYANPVNYEEGWWLYAEDVSIEDPNFFYLFNGAGPEIITGDDAI